MHIKDNFNDIKDLIIAEAKKCHRNPDDIQLIAVSKKQTDQKIMSAIQLGAQSFGENYIQEAKQKIEVVERMVQEQNLPKPSWHFIGHLQRNKAKYAVRYFDWIHSVDSLALMEEIDRCAQKRNKCQKILIQVSTGEIQKSGIPPEELVSMMQCGIHLKNISICGLMVMPPYAQEPENSRPYFKKLAQLLNQIRAKFPDNPDHPLNHLSMGMTGDYLVAIQEGATFLRVGTAIFGKRL